MNSPRSITSSKQTRLDDNQALVGLGANLPSPAGPPLRTLALAVERLQQLALEPVCCSEVMTTAPDNCPPGSPPFHNAVALLRVDPSMTPVDLLQSLQAIELEFGRRRSGIINEPRSLDLDLLCFGQQELSLADLQLPHPRAHLRQFVLAPLQQLLPELQLPGQREPVHRLLVALDQS